MSGLRSTASWGARLGLLASGLVASILIVEIFIRVWAVTVATRAEEDAPSDGHLVVLCIGDSHTWGRGRGYPQRMAARLAERSARYRIVNLGVPGTNTAQLRRRLPEQIDRYDPQLIVVWSGVNNAWNRSDADFRSGGSTPSGWERLLDYSRIVRFVRVWRHQHVLQQLFADQGAYLSPRPEPRRTPGGTTFERSLPGGSDEYVNRPGAALHDDALVEVTRDDLAWIVEHSRERGVPVVLIAYGLPNGPYGNATFGIRAAAEATGAPLASPVRWHSTSFCDSKPVRPTSRRSTTTPSTRPSRCTKLWAIG